MKKARLAGILLAGAMALNGVPYIAQPVGISVSAASKLAAPTGFGGSATDTSVTLTWKAVSGADAYRVFKYNASTKKYEKYKNVASPSCKVTGLNPGTSYLFKVTALVKSGSKYTAQTYSSDVRIKTKLAAPAGLKVSAKSSTSVALSWSAVKGADAYRVYYATSANGTPKVYKNVETTSCTVKGLTAGKTYWFTVAALVKKGNKYTVQTSCAAVSASTSGQSSSSSSFGSMLSFPEYGISGAAAAKALGMTNYVTQTQESKGAKITAYSGTVTVNGKMVVVILLENAKKQYFGGAAVYDGKTVTFDSAYSHFKSTLGKPAMNYDMMGFQMYLWADTALNVTMLMGGDTEGDSVTMYYVMSYKYAPDEIKSSVSDGNITSLFA